MASKQISELPALSATGQLSSTASFVVDQGTSSQNMYKVSFGEIKDAIAAETINMVPRTTYIDNISVAFLSVDNPEEYQMSAITVTAWPDGTVNQTWYHNNIRTAANSTATIAIPVMYGESRPVSFTRSPVLPYNVTALTAGYAVGCSREITKRYVVCACPKGSQISGYWCTAIGHIENLDLSVGQSSAFLGSKMIRTPGKYRVECVGRGASFNSQTVTKHRKLATGSYAGGTVDIDDVCVIAYHPIYVYDTYSSETVTPLNYNVQGFVFSGKRFSLSAECTYVNPYGEYGIDNFPGSAGRTGMDGLDDAVAIGGKSLAGADEYEINKIVVGGREIRYGAGQGYEGTGTYVHPWMESGFSTNPAIIVTRLA